MSFYGNVFYELTNAFASMIIKNSGKTGKSFIETPENATIEAVGLNSKFSLDTGNRWLTIKGDPDNTTSTFYHAAADTSANNSKTTFETVDALPSGKTAVELEPEQLVKISSLRYDDAGHVTGQVVDNYFKMPKNDYNTDMNDLKDRMDELEKSDADQSKDINDAVKLVTDTVGGLEQRFTNIDNEFDTITDRFDTNEKSMKSLQDTVIGSQESLGETERTITEIIGALNQSEIVNKIPGQPTVAGSVTYLVKEIDSTDDMMKTLNTSIKAYFQNLCNELNKKGIDISIGNIIV